MSLTCEALATKTELENQIQTLRNEINALLGRTDSGTTINVLEAGTLSGTKLGAGLLYDLEITYDEETRAWEMNKTGLDSTSQKLEGATPGISRIGDTGLANVEVNKAAVGGVALQLFNWASITLALKNIVDLFFMKEDSLKREQAINNLYGYFEDLSKAYQEANGDLAEAQGIIDRQEGDIEILKGNNETLKQDLATQGTIINEINDKFDIAEGTSLVLTRNVETLKTNIEGYRTWAEREMGELLESILGLQANLSVESQNVENLRNIAVTYGNKVAELEGTATELDDRLGRAETSVAIVRAEYNQLQTAIDDNTTLIESGLTTVAAESLLTRIRVRKLEDEVSTLSGGSAGIPANVQSGFTNVYNNFGTLVSALLGNPPTVTEEDTELAVPTTTTWDDILNNENAWDDVLPTMISQVPNITGGTEVTPTELADFGTALREGVRSDFENTLLVAGLAGLAPKVDNINSQTSPANIANAAEAGVCNSVTSPTGCMRNNFIDPFKNNFSNIASALGIGADGLTLASNLKILEKVNQTQEFLGKAWGSTVVQSTLNATNTILAFHNAVMLSRNLTASIGEVSSVVLNALPIPGFDETDIDVNGFVDGKLEDFATAVLGVEGYSALVNATNSANRILVAGQGIVASVHGIKNALQEGQEVIANRIGTLGNTFMEQGILEDNSFPWMSTNTNFKNPFFGFTQKVEDIDQFTNDINQLVQSGLEIQENFNALAEGSEEFKSASDKLKESFEVFDTDKTTEEEARAIESASPEIERLDLIQLEEDEL